MLQYQEISLDIFEQNFEKVTAVQWDKDSRGLKVNITDQGESYTIPSGTTAIIKYKKPDGTGIFNDCQVSNNQVVVVFTEEMLAAAGTTKANIVLVQGSTILSSLSFTLEIQASSLKNEEIESHYEADVLENVILASNQAAIASATAITSANNAKTSATEAGQAAQSAKEKSESASASQASAAQSAEQAEKAKEEAMSTTPQGYQELVESVVYVDDEGYLCSRKE